MVKFSTPFTTSAALLLAAATAASVPDGTWPTSTGTVQYSEAYVIKAGEVFDGKLQTFERSDVTCEGQTESGSDTAVFKLEPGATLKNAIIGKNQMEGVHCDKHDCTIDNVWWDDVCEDALSIKGGTASSVSTVTGGGARSADDKVIQHNGYGTVKIDGFYGEDISKLYRSCGTCGDRPKKVEVSNVYIVNPDNAVVTVNKNWGDEATLSNIWVKSAGDKVKICQWSEGNADGEPKMLGDGPSPPLCQYSESDVHINGDVSQATGTSTSSSIGSSSTPTTSTASSQESAGSASTSVQIPSNSSTASSESDAPGTVAPAGSNGSEQTSVSTASSQTQQEESNGESTDETSQTQQSSTSSKKNDGNGDDAQNEEQTIASSASGSTTSGDNTSSPDAGSVTLSSSTGSTTQSSSTGSTTQSSSAESTAQTSTNSSTSTSTSSGSLPDGTWPASTGTVQYTKPYTIKAGEVFDGKMQTFERSDITCSEGEGQKDTAVFLVEAGGTLKNAIIGKNQKEGVHCDDHDCTIDNVWWDDVCEDALSIKGGSASSVTTVTNCGARYASDKVVQHNGQGTVKINGFFAQEFGKLYRSCGTCGDIPRTVTVENVYAIDPLVSIVTVNKNYNDQATLSNIHVKTTDGKDNVKVCQWSQGGSSPSNLGDGPSGTLCQYSESDVHINQ
ncbi:putative pectate lyase D [Phytophthora citrophthora]|uniref:Probable pectate lyase F n=1 Tax=Phytophthora citrophthora TaxID=4793 RepID=A0AAD9LE71_9STRA|nr:putative pectate lyase D [Phytophthora citrophthora]